MLSAVEKRFTCKQKDMTTFALQLCALHPVHVKVPYLTNNMNRKGPPNPGSQTVSVAEDECLICSSEKPLDFSKL